MSDIKLRNNVNVRDGEGRVFVLAHGFGCDQHMWDRLISTFDPNDKLIMFDYVGSGQSQLSAFSTQRYSSIDGYAQDIIEVCDSLMVQDAIFVGHSVSCSAGMVASNNRPDLFSALIMIGPSPCFLNLPPDYHGGFDSSDLEDLLALMDQNFVGWANYLAPVVAGASGEGEIAGELSDSFCSTDPIVAKTFAKTTFFADNRVDFAANNKPCLLLQHRNDTLAPLTVGEYLANSVSNSDFQIIDVNGHCAHMSHPDLVASHIQPFVAKLGL